VYRCGGSGISAKLCTKIEGRIAGWMRFEFGKFMAEGAD